MGSEDKDTGLRGVGCATHRFSSAEFAQAVNSIRADPLVHIEFLRDPSYLTSEGASCRAGLVTFLQNVKPIEIPLSHSDMLCQSSREASCAFVSPPPAHTVDLPSLISAHFPGTSACGEMFWCSKSYPPSPMHIIRDFLLDAGVPSRSHRVGLFDADFTHIGSHMEQRDSGYIVFYVHFCGYYASSALTDRVSWGQEVSTRPVLGEVILLCSTDEENGSPKQKKQHLDEEIGNIASPARDRTGGSSERAKRHADANRRSGTVKSESEFQPMDRRIVSQATDVAHIRCDRAHSPSECIPSFSVEAQSPNTSQLFEAASRQTQGGSARDEHIPPTSASLFDSVFVTDRPNPTEFFSNLCAKLELVPKDIAFMPEGLKMGAFSPRERETVMSRPGDFDLYVEENSGYIFPTTLLPYRSSMRRLLQTLRSAGESPVSLTILRNQVPEEEYAMLHCVETMLDSGEINIDEDEAVITAACGIPHVLPWERQIGEARTSYNREQYINTGTPVVQQRYEYPLRSATDVRSAEPAPLFAGISVSSPSLSQLLPQPLLPAVDTPTLSAAIVRFHDKHSQAAKPSMMLEYIKEYPDTAPNSRKFSAELMRLFFTETDPDLCPLVYVPIRGWFVYQSRWIEQGDEKLQITQLLQMGFLTAVSQIKSLVSRLNIFKPSRDGKMHQRKKFILDLELSLSSARHISELLYEARPYFLRTLPMDSDPMLLQLQNATVDLRTNTIRESRPGDYLTRASSISVPDYAMEGSSIDEPPDAVSNREWAYNFIWSIFQPGIDGAPHPYDKYDELGDQNAANFRYFLLFLARILEGRPLKRCFFFFSPRGRNSKRPIEIIASQLLGTYYAQCKHSIFTNDKRSDEANSAVSLSRRDARLLFGQEIDRANPWCNSVFKRRADGGREGGTRKNSNAFEEYDPVYTICFGTNAPPSFAQIPNNSEADRTVVMYLPNRFCDEEDILKEPLSPRRFLKKDVEPILSRPEIMWAIFDILLRVRRESRDLDDEISAATPTARWWKAQWFPNVTGKYISERIEARANSWLRTHECVSDFREWASALPPSTFDYSRVTETSARLILDSCLCRPVPHKKLLCYKGFAFKEGDREDKHVYVGMSKRLALVPRGRPLGQGCCNCSSGPHLHDAQCEGPSRRISLVPNAHMCSHLPEAASGSADVHLVGVSKRLALVQKGSTVEQGDCNLPSAPHIHRAQYDAPCARLTLVPNTHKASPSHEASSGSFDVDLVESTTERRKLCLCRAYVVPKSLRGRVHYHCVLDSCLYVTDRETRLDAHEDRHEGAHEGENDRPPCHRGCLTSPRGVPVKHYHCRICLNAFDRLVRVLRHETSHAGSEKSTAAGRLPLFANPRVDNMVGWACARLTKIDAIPLAFSEAVSQLIRTSLGIRPNGSLRPDVHNSASWVEVFRVKEFNIAPHGKTKALVVHDIRPTVWVVRTKSTEDLRGVAYNQRVLWLPRLGFFTLQYCLHVWSLYFDSLNLEAVRRSLLHEWAAYLRSELTDRPTEDPTEYDWVLSLVPSSYVIRGVLLRTSSLHDKWRRELKASLALLDGNVLRLDGHFKLPAKINVSPDGKETPCMLACLGCSGYLLQEVTLVPSEAGESYLRAILDILVLRKENGMPPPHIIIDNPCLLESDVHNLISAVWGDREKEYVLAGDPVHRKIEFDESLDSTHQDARDAMRDFAYIVRRFGGLIPAPQDSTLDAELQKLSAEISDIKGRMYEYNIDPFSARHPENIRNWKSTPTRQCYMDTFRSQAEDISDFPPFPTNHSRILSTYFRTGRLARVLPLDLRNNLIDYRENAMALNRLLLPCGAIRRILLADAKKRYGRNAPRRISEDCDIFPSYTGHRELKQEVTRLILWYNATWRVTGVRRRFTPREDVEISSPATYPMKTNPIFGVKTIDVLRRMLLLQNSAYYLAHVLVANDVYRRNPYPDAVSKSHDGASRSKEHPFSMRATLGKGKPNRCNSDDSDTSCSIEQTIQDGGEDVARADNRIFSLGTASVEAFFSEIRQVIRQLLRLRPRI